MNNEAPVKVGDEITVRIEDVGEKGDGFTKIKGFVLFIPKTKQGDLVKIKVNKVFSKVGFAEVIEHVHEPQVQEKKVEYDESLDSEDFGEE
jgi:predicted RNA-binding protein with TRAM domain